jgi:Transposase DDE domain group 1
MVKRATEHIEKKPAKQAVEESESKANKIRASTPYDFTAKNLTAVGGLLPIATMLEKLGFQKLVEETVTSGRKTRAMSLYHFVLGIVLGYYTGFQRLNQLRFIARDPMLTGILGVERLPPQSTLWRFLAGLYAHVVGQLLKIQRVMQERVWQAANVRLETATLDTDTTVQTVYGKKMGARKSYNPKNKGKLSYQPILTFIAETREYLYGQLHNGHRPDGQEIKEHIRQAIARLPRGVKQIFGRADSGFYCQEAVQAYEEDSRCQFVICAQKTDRLVEQLQKADWKPSPKTDADEQCEFEYQPRGWAKAYRFVALRYDKVAREAQKQKKGKKARQAEGEDEAEQYQLFDTAPYEYRVFVTNMSESIAYVVWFYRQRAGAENLIKEANADAGLAAIPSARFDTNHIHFQLAMLAYNLSCWLLLFNREPEADATKLKHTTMVIARLRFLFIAAKLWRHSGYTGVRYSDRYEEQGVFDQLMSRLRGIHMQGDGYAPVLQPALS